MRYSEFELEVLQVFWEQGDLTAPEVHKVIENQRPVAYNTVKTIIDRLEKKGGLKRVRQFGRTLLFRAEVDQEAVTKPMVHRFLDRLFHGDRKELMSHLFQNEDLSDEEVRYLENLIQKRQRQKGGS